MFPFLLPASSLSMWDSFLPHEEAPELPSWGRALGGGGCSPQLGAGSLECFCSRLPVCYRCDSMRAWVRLGGFTSAPRYCQWKKEKKKQIQVTR